ncbi:hypothetical protein FGO68_gene3829 [Halteria grandinella]|uniref:Uncharacterized protein n=1 Tax=Halteria grandinella TaxID=5974 RepID=A0A8J8P7D6_HALGN|nr:hypothetical protein FGO68_gene3829 [Halteria grandinella]
MLLNKIQNPYCQLLNQLMTSINSYQQQAFLLFTGYLAKCTRCEPKYNEDFASMHKLYQYFSFNRHILTAGRDRNDLFKSGQNTNKFDKMIVTQSGSEETLTVLIQLRGSSVNQSCSSLERDYLRYASLFERIVIFTQVNSKPVLKVRG